MSKCRYDLSEDCHNKDCLACVFDKMCAEILEYIDDLDIAYEIGGVFDKYEAKIESQESEE